MSVSLATVTTQANAVAANDQREADFDAFTREKGREDAVGGDALASWSIGFVRAVSDDVFDIAKDKNGEDAATRKFKLYSSSKGKKAYHDRSEGSQKAQVSKLRQLQNAAANPKFDFVDVLNRAVIIRQQAIDDGIDVKSPYPAYVDVAREQLKLDDEMDDAMIFATVTKTESTREVTVEGQLKKAQKIIDDLIAGEKHPGVHDNAPETMQVGELLKARINDLAQLKQQQEDDAKLAEIAARRSV